MTTTDIILIATVILLVLYDIFAVIKYGLDGTITVRVYDFSVKYPVVPFALGVVIGHLYWCECRSVGH